MSWILHLSGVGRDNSQVASLALLALQQPQCDVKHHLGLLAVEDRG